MNSARATRPAPATPGTAGYRERLAAPPSWWFIGFLFGVGLGIILLVTGPWQALGGLGVGTLLGWWTVVAYGRPEIRIEDGTLIAGSATLPAAALGAAVALDSEKSRALRSYEADPRAFMLLRSYITTAVRVEVADPDDPTPYLYLSTRRPKELAAAVNALTR